MTSFCFLQDLKAHHYIFKPTASMFKSPYSFRKLLNIIYTGKYVKMNSGYNFCATTCSVSQKLIGPGCVLRRITPLLFQQPDSLLLVIVPSRSPAVAYGTVCQLTSRPQQLCLFMFSFKIILIFCFYPCMTCVRSTLTLFSAFAVCI